MKRMFGISFVFLISFAFSFLVTIYLTQKQTAQKELKKTSIVSPTLMIPKKEFLVKGSIPYWDQKNAFESFSENAAVFDYINLFWYYLGLDGSVLKYQYANEDIGVIDFAHENNVKVSMVITNLAEDGNWSSKRVENVISDKVLRKAHIENIVFKLKELNFDGVIIDYELLQPNLKDKYLNFVQELYQTLQKENKILTVVLHPKTGDNVKSEKISQYQDWEALAKYSDQLQIMGYSEHSDEDEAGPIAGADWVSKIIDYAKSKNIPLEKIFLGIPLYGYDWSKSSNLPAKGLTFSDVENLIYFYNPSVIWSDESKSPHFEYGKFHEVWFENGRSVMAKAQLARDAGFAGITFWRLGGEDPEIWEMLQR